MTRFPWRIVFFGTPAFAIPVLKNLLQGSEEVVAVVTQPDREKGRGRKPVSSPVKEIALQQGLPLFQPEKVREETFQNNIKGLQPDLFVVVAYGQILPKSLLEIPWHGAINVHASLLPKYRGAAPIPWPILKGESVTGVTTMLMDEGMDTGGMLLQETLSITPDDTAGSLSPRLADVGGRLLVETIARLKAGTLAPRPQDHSQATLAPLLKKEDGLIDWTLPAGSIANRVRGLNPWPGAYTFAGAERWVLCRAAALSVPTGAQPGRVTAVTRDALHVGTGDGLLAIQELQPANSRRMTVAQYLAGHPIQPGLQFGRTASP